MAGARTGPEWIDLGSVDDVRDAVHRAVACLAQGGVVGLPTETGQGLVASALSPDAVARCAVFARGNSAQALTILMRDADEAADWIDGLGELGRKFVRRGWPGPFLLVSSAGPNSLAARLPAPVRDLVIADGLIATHAPSEGLLDDILWLSSGPVLMVGLASGASESTGWELESPMLESVELVLEGLPSPPRTAMSAVRVAGERWSMLDAGGLPTDEIRAMSCTAWLFVCTGNTCRSPMAEAICKVLLANRLECQVDDLIARGYSIRSAGMGATGGMPPAAHAAEVVASRGGSLMTHQSRRATRALLRGADMVIALSGEHLEAILDFAPDVADRARLLHAEGLDIADPIGSDRARYQETARIIEANIERLLDDLGL